MSLLWKLAEYALYTFYSVEMNLPWQPFPESKTPATDKCVITPDEFARTQNRYGLGQCKRIAPKNCMSLR